MEYGFEIHRGDLPCEAQMDEQVTLNDEAKGSKPLTGTKKGVNMDYIQCKLEKEGMVRVGYIPKYAARIGVLVSMMNEDWEPKQFDDGWIVKEIYPSTQHTEEFVKSHERDFKKFDY